MPIPVPHGYLLVARAKALRQTQRPEGPSAKGRPDLDPRRQACIRHRWLRNNHLCVGQAGHDRQHTGDIADGTVEAEFTDERPSLENSLRQLLGSDEQPHRYGNIER